MIKEAAERLQVEERTVRYWIATGDLKAVNVSRSAASKKPRLRIDPPLASVWIDNGEAVSNPGGFRALGDGGACAHRLCVHRAHTLGIVNSQRYAGRTRILV